MRPRLVLPGAELRAGRSNPEQGHVVEDCVLAEDADVAAHLDRAPTGVAKGEKHLARINAGSRQGGWLTRTIDTRGCRAVDAGIKADGHIDIEVCLSRRRAEHERRRQQAVSNCGGMISGTGETAGHRGARTRVVAFRTHVKGINVAGKIDLPIARVHVYSGNRGGHRNNPDRGADRDCKLGALFHEKLPSVSFLCPDVERQSRSALFSLVARPRRSVGLSLF